MFEMNLFFKLGEWTEVHDTIFVKAAILAAALVLTSYCK